MTVKSNTSLNRATLVGGLFILAMTGVAFVVGSLSNVFFFKTAGKNALEMAGGNFDKIIPLYITSATPEWFSYIFMVVDPILVALPIAFLATIMVSLFTAKSAPSHLNRCFTEL